MSDRKYYCFCDSGCKFETMSKEQILAAITQALNGGGIGEVDTGFITTIKTINGTPLKFFVGTQSEYEILTDKEKQNLFALITNDIAREAFLEAIDEIQRRLYSIEERLVTLEDNSSGSGGTSGGTGGGTSGGTSGGTGSLLIVQVTIKNNSSVTISGTYTNSENQSGTTYQVAASGTKTLYVVKGTIVKFNSAYGGSALTVRNSSYGYGPHANGGYYFVANSVGTIEIVDPAFTVNVSYSGGNAILTWTSVAGAERYDVYANGNIIGSASGTTYTVTPAEVLGLSSCECAVAAAGSTGGTLAVGRVSIDTTKLNFGVG